MAKIVTSCLSNISLKSSYFVGNPDSVTFLSCPIGIFSNFWLHQKPKKRAIFQALFPS